MEPYKGMQPLGDENVAAMTEAGRGRGVFEEVGRTQQQGSKV